MSPILVFSTIVWPNSAVLRNERLQNVRVLDLSLALSLDLSLAGSFKIKYDYAAGGSPCVTFY